VLVSVVGLLGERSQTKVKHSCSDSKAQAKGCRAQASTRGKLPSGNKKDTQRFPHHFAGERTAPTTDSLLRGMKFLISSDVSSESN